MKDSKRSLVKATLGMMLVGGLWAYPATQAHRAAVVASQQATAEPNSVTGKIASAKGSQFTVEVQRKDGSIEPVKFTTDRSSNVQGKAVEGATADVTYRVKDGKNIVITAHFTPPRDSGH